MHRPADRMLGWRSGGLVLLAGAVLALGIIVWNGLSGRQSAERAVGDGVSVESYGFSLEPLLVPRDTLVPTTFSKDGLPTLDDPPTMNADEVDSFNEEQWGNYLVSEDRVIGVELNGEARAYPLRVLNWHEIVNDSLGEVPIAVTYHPLCDSVVVFDRRVQGETLQFGVSGLVSDSNLLMYDRRTDGVAESLFSQLDARAVAGPRAAQAQTLEVLAVSLTSWRRWRERHPATSVLRPDVMQLKNYRRNPYGRYFMAGKPRFPVRGPPAAGDLAPMDPILVVQTDRETRVHVVKGRVPRVEHPAFSLALDEDAVSVLVEPEPGLRTIYSRWFAWSARHPVAAR